MWCLKMVENKPEFSPSDMRFQVHKLETIIVELTKKTIELEKQIEALKYKVNIVEESDYKDLEYSGDMVI